MEEIAGYYIQNKDNELVIKTANTATESPSSLKTFRETILENIMTVGFTDTRINCVKYKEFTQQSNDYEIE